MRPGGEELSAVIDRRTFLAWAPRQTLAGVRGLVRGAGLGLIAERPSAGLECRRAVAVIDLPRCLAWGGTPCQACYLRCPLRDQAIVLDDQRPLIVASACDGCGVCVEACLAVNDLGAARLAAL
jgi:Pyruvate/2-oxoacid:ferredoxin oxidoreductase delta subunit